MVNEKRAFMVIVDISNGVGVRRTTEIRHYKWILPSTVFLET